jgi:hypothetical protein
MFKVYELMSFKKIIRKTLRFVYKRNSELTSDLTAKNRIAENITSKIKYVRVKPYFFVI